MTLPSISKSYVYNVNNSVLTTGTTQGDYRNLWYKWKTALVAGGWTVRSSSDSVTAAASDLWTSTAALVWGSSARSWIVLRHPVCLWDVCLELNPASSYHTGTINVSRQGYVTTGLVTTARPGLVAADEQTLLSSGGTVAWGNSPQNFVWHYVRSSDNEIQRFFVNVTDTTVLAFFMDVPQSPITGWNSGFVQPPGTAFWMNAASVGNAVSTATYTGTPTVTRIGAGAGTATGLYLSGLSYASNLVVNGLPIPNDMTGEYPLLAAGYICTGVVGFRGKVGNPYDLWFGVSNMPTGTTYPADLSTQFAQFGTIVIPWKSNTVPVTR